MALLQEIRPRGCQTHQRANPSMIFVLHGLLRDQWIAGRDRSSFGVLLKDVCCPWIPPVSVFCYSLTMPSGRNKMITSFPPWHSLSTLFYDGCSSLMSCLTVAQKQWSQAILDWSLWNHYAQELSVLFCFLQVLCLRNEKLTDTEHRSTGTRNSVPTDIPKYMTALKDCLNILASSWCPGECVRE